ncbi:hypothetical protein ANCDUO_23394, partial [Ancylostoma duodenale]
NPALWPNELKTAVAAGCRVTPSFITEEEENELLREVEPHMKRLRYEKSHWDDAIHLYREREQRKWSPANEKVIQRIRYYCGDVITGVCLLSDAVMRLRHKDRKDELIVDLMLPRRCLYRMGEEGRYEFTHEVLSNEESIFNGKKVEKTRRISIICRDLPHPENQAEAAAIRMKPIPEAA